MPRRRAARPLLLLPLLLGAAPTLLCVNPTDGRPEKTNKQTTTITATSVLAAGASALRRVGLHETVSIWADSLASPQGGERVPFDRLPLCLALEHQTGRPLVETAMQVRICIAGQMISKVSDLPRGEGHRPHAHDQRATLHGASEPAGSSSSVRARQGGLLLPPVRTRTTRGISLTRA